MKKTVSTLFLVCLCLLSIGQERLKVSETHGDYFKQKARSIYNIYESSAGGYWSIGQDMVQKLDKDLNLVEEKKLDLYYDGKFMQLEEIVQFKHEFYLFMSYVNVKKKKKYLFYTLFDPYSLAPEGEIYKVAEVKAATEKRMRKGSFHIAVSNNENFILISGNDAQNIPKKRKSFFGRSSSSSSTKGDHTFKFTYWVMDEKMQIVNYVKRHELIIENSSDKFFVRQVTVDDSGSVYILGQNTVIEEYNSMGERLKAGKSKSIQTAAFILEKIDPDGFNYQYKTNEGEIFVDMRLLFTKDGKPLLVGLSGEEYTLTKSVLTTGVYRVSFDKELNVISELNESFSDEVLEGVNDIREREANMSDRRRRRSERRDARRSEEQQAMRELAKKAALNINSIQFAGIDENGEPVIVLEERYVIVVQHTTTNANGSTTTTYTYYYHYEDLIMVKFTEDEVLQNFQKKTFVSVNNSLDRGLDVSLKNGNITILAQQNIIRANSDLSHVKEYQLNAFAKRQDVKHSGKRIFEYRKTLNDDVMLAAARYKRKFMWYKFEIQN